MTAVSPVFLSYASKDSAAAELVVRALTTAGVSVWQDKTGIKGGDLYKASIIRGMREASVVLLLCSPHSLASDNVAAELDTAWDEFRKPILQVWIVERQGCPIPDRFVLLLNRGRQYLQIHGRSEREWLPELLEALAGLGVLPVVGKNGRVNRPRAAAAPVGTEPPRRKRGWLVWAALAAVALIVASGAVCVFALPRVGVNPSGPQASTTSAYNGKPTMAHAEAIRAGMTGAEVAAMFGGNRGAPAPGSELNKCTNRARANVEKEWNVAAGKGNVWMWGEHPAQVFVAFDDGPLVGGKVAAVVAFFDDRLYTLVKFKTR